MDTRERIAPRAWPGRDPRSVPLYVPPSNGNFPLWPHAWTIAGFIRVLFYGTIGTAGLAAIALGIAALFGA
jgi:hypothetical protein